MADTKKLISFTVPVFNEEECIYQFIKEVDEVMATISNYNYEYIFVDDGSKDNTVNLIKAKAKNRDNIKLIEFSYNHGKQAAITAAINHAKGDYLIYMDPDLQDPPEEIPRLLNKIEEGYDLVFGIREEKQDSIINKLFSSIFWSTLNIFTGLNIPKGLAVYRIFNRKFADEFCKYTEQNRFIEGIFIKISMNWTTLQVSQRKRFAGKTKFNFKRKMELAFNAIIDFSDLPLNITIKFGFILMAIGLLTLLTIVGLIVSGFDFQSGWPSLIGTIVLGFGVQLFFLGIIARYIGKIYKESKRRPLYSIKQTTNF